MKVFAIHGFNVSDSGEGSVENHRKGFELAGFTFEVLSYPWHFVLGTYVFNKYHAKRFAKKLAKLDEPYILLGHSNGNAIIKWMIKDYGATPEGWIIINGALDVDTEMPDIPFIHIYYNNGDTPTAWAKFLPWHSWGAMGRLGYRGRPKNNVTQWNSSATKGLPRVYGHSDMYSGSKINKWTEFIAKNIILEG